MTKEEIFRQSYENGKLKEYNNLRKQGFDHNQALSKLLDWTDDDEFEYANGGPDKIQKKAALWGSISRAHKRSIDEKNRITSDKYLNRLLDSYDSLNRIKRDDEGRAKAIAELREMMKKL